MNPDPVGSSGTGWCLGSHEISFSQILHEYHFGAEQYAYSARLQHKGGYSPYLTVLDAEQQLFPAELNLAQARASLCAAYVTLYQAMGGGWVVLAEKMTDAGSTKQHGGYTEE